MSISGEANERAVELRDEVQNLVEKAARDHARRHGALSEAEQDHWWDEIQEGVMDAFEGLPVAVASTEERS